MSHGRVIVVGAGAVGGSIGALLHDSGSQVVLVARGAHGTAIRTNGLELRMPDRALVAHVPCVQHPSDLVARPGDVVILATKLQDARAALGDLHACFGPSLPIVCATNGVQAEPWAAERFRTVLSMMVWMPAAHLDAGLVRLYATTPRGALDVGVYPAGPTAPVLALRDALRRAGFDSEARGDVLRWKHAKWLTNLGNTACALAGSRACPADDGQALAAAARAEGEVVLDLAGLDRVPSSTFLERVRCVEALDVDSAPRPGGSTWQSLQRGRPLETPWLEGALVALAESLGHPAPYNRALVHAAEHVAGIQRP